MKHILPECSNYKAPSGREILKEGAYRDRKVLILAGVGAMLISSGPACLSFVITDRAIDYRVYLTCIPLTLLILTGLWVSYRLLLPRFLRRFDFVRYALAVWLLGFVVEYIAFWASSYMLPALGLQELNRNFLSWQAISSSIISGLMMAMLYFSASLPEIYRATLKVTEEEGAKAEEMRRRLEAFKQRIDMNVVKEQLRKIRHAVRSGTEQSHPLILELSEYLRTRLYDKSLTRDVSPSTFLDLNRIDNLIASRRYRWLRHFGVILMLLLMSMGTLFEGPDVIVLDAPHICSAVFLFVFLLLIAYINTYIIFPFFRRRGREKVYVWGVASLIVLFLALLLLMNYGRPEYNRNGIIVPAPVMVIGFLGTLVSLLSIIVGSASFVVFRNLIAVRWRMAMLENQSARVELEGLQQQINPHFLFNMLNNISILSYEDKEDALETLGDFERLMEYRLTDSSHRITTPRSEAESVILYLNIEKNAGKPIDFRLNEDFYPGSADIPIPPLLIIPFVENAVKHSVPYDGYKRIRVSIKTDKNNLTFHCVNSWSALKTGNLSLKSARSGGLGIANTRRRLQLLYGTHFTLANRISATEYAVTLRIPLKVSHAAKLNVDHRPAQ